MQGTRTLALMGGTKATGANVTGTGTLSDPGTRGTNVGTRTNLGGRSGRTPDKPDKPGDGPRKETGRRTGSPDGKVKPPVKDGAKRARQKGTKAIGSSNDRVDYTKKGFFKLGGGRYFERAACVDVLVREYSFAREKAMKMCFECGLSDFDDCAMCPTPAKKGHTTKTDDLHTFPEDFHIVCRKLVQ